MIIVYCSQYWNIMSYRILKYTCKVISCTTMHPVNSFDMHTTLFISKGDKYYTKFKNNYNSHLINGKSSSLSFPREKYYCYLLEYHNQMIDRDNKPYNNLDDTIKETS